MAKQEIQLRPLTDRAEEAINPSGMMAPFAGAASPMGWLLCDGAAVNRTTYANLFAVVGTAYGEGDGSTTFNLPDTRGRFLRGLDGDAGRDPDKASRTASATGGNTGNNVGSVQDDANASHSHAFSLTAASAGNHTHAPLSARKMKGTTGSNINQGSAPALENGTAVESTGASAAVASGGAHTHSVTGSITNAGATEARPKNVYVNYIIKI